MLPSKPPLNSTKPVSAACIAVSTSPPVTRPVLAEATLPITGLSAGVVVEFATVKIFVFVDVTSVTDPVKGATTSIVICPDELAVKPIPPPAVICTFELSVPEVEVRLKSTSEPCVVTLTSYVS